MTTRTKEYTEEDVRLAERYAAALKEIKENK